MDENYVKFSNCECSLVFTVPFHPCPKLNCIFFLKPSLPCRAPGISIILSFWQRICKGQTKQTHGLISAADDDSLGGALDSVGREESQVLGLEGVLVGEVSTSRLGL